MNKLGVFTIIIGFAMVVQPIFASDKTTTTKKVNNSDEIATISALNNYKRFPYVFIATINKCQETTIKICDKCTPVKGFMASAHETCNWKMERGYMEPIPTKIFIKDSKNSCDIFFKEKPFIYQNYLIFGRKITLEKDPIIYTEINMIKRLDLEKEEIGNLHYNYSFTEEELTNGQSLLVEQKREPNCAY